MKIIPTDIPEILLIEPRVFKDPRGFFLETFNANRYSEFGTAKTFVQDNHSQSTKGILRGLHYQLKSPQAKLLYVVSGAIFDVAVDIRKGSPTFGKWVGAILSAENKYQLYVPEGFAHGFSVLSETADVTYKCTDFYNPQDEYGVMWNDEAIGIDWNVEGSPLISEKDAKLPRLSQIPDDQLPIY